MAKFAANLSMLFTEVDFMDRFEAAAEAGFQGVEYLFPYAFDAQAIKAKLDANNLEQVLFNLPAGDWDSGDRGIAVDPARVEEFQAGVPKAIAYAKALGCTQVNCLAGIVPQGVTQQDAQSAFVINLHYAANALAAEGISLVIEAINTRDIPGFFLNTTEQAKAIIKEVGSDNLSINTIFITCKLWKAILRRPCSRTLVKSHTCNWRIIQVDTNRVPEKSIIHSCSIILMSLAIKAGWAANTNLKRQRQKALVGCTSTVNCVW